MNGLKALIMCGAAIFPGRCDKRAFLEALSMSARESYAELGKWFFVEREADIIFTGHGMDLLRRTDYCGPDLVIPFLIRLAETCRTDPAQSEAVISMVKRTFQLFGDNADDSLSKLLGEIWASQALPSKLLLEDDQVSEYGQAYHLFLCKAETEAALHIFCKGTTINDDTSKQLAFFQYAEASFVRLTDTYQKLCPEDTALLGNIEDMARKATVAARNCRKILELEQLLESLEQQ